jgi:hypothetical protein
VYADEPLKCIENELLFSRSVPLSPNPPPLLADGPLVGTNGLRLSKALPVWLVLIEPRSGPTPGCVMISMKTPPA